MTVSSCEMGGMKHCSRTRPQMSLCVDQTYKARLISISGARRGPAIPRCRVQEVIPTHKLLVLDATVRDL
jgi:hypothetical protein